MKTKYQYKNPLDEGFKKLQLNKRQIKELFPKRKIKVFDKYEFYYSDKAILIHKSTNIFGIILVTFLFPLSIFINGFKDALTDLHSLYNQKKLGHFSSEYIWNKDPRYDKIIDYRNLKELIKIHH